MLLTIPIAPEHLNKLQSCTQSWWAELKNSKGLEQIQNIFYTHLGINRFAKIGSDLTTKVGCGIYNCTSIVNIVCRYETTLANGKKLYTAGPTCNKCKDTCANGLCPAVATGDL
ncbi:hypothetical protein OESDEN_05426 [Oesophagostomum dentatum]|uniref:SCP domain-containing protein n=1 Tax=Oesophagostomum dentatum TaxID=61180 RepID=A0A0B1TFT4_OESDE|nr:hypothetical protein OESDEN_05426 [Oesophagostomum dentatum]